ncbi:putative aldehyde reductase protein [Neofusicoccum parvum UCRNP2]|uniref:Putative aldehyde reductase protein n=1 Tax=Botryosphaeria parva (strain UCR-NP2) TaxID=1287680 RepID=R1G5K6_BOTPV|nr:putative aldehyde reductase protein [Neofusicoccum parvum UCRNP2]
MSPIDAPAIPKSSTVLVTGVNGFIGSHVADQFLKHGYMVRGASRDLKKHAWIKNHFDNIYGKGKFEQVAVPDMEATGAYDDAVKGMQIVLNLRTARTASLNIIGTGVSAVVHTATTYSMDPNPYNVVPGTLAGVRNALEAAAKEATVKRFVLTSSSASALIPRPNEEVTVTADTWNELAIKDAYREPPYEPERAYPVYAASKTLAEKEAWKFVQENKPGFILNTVLPNINFGKTLDLVNQGHTSTSSMIIELFNGNSEPLSGLPAHVQDDAILHVAAVIHPEVENERVFAFSEPCNGDGILEVLRKLYPDRKFPKNFQSTKDLSIIVPRARAKKLLKDMGKSEWTSLEDSIRMNTEDIA